MTEIVLRRRRRLPALRRRTRQLAPLLVGILGLGWLLFPVDEPSGDVVLGLPTPPAAPAPVVRVPDVAPAEPVAMRDGERPAPPSQPRSTVAAATPVISTTDTSPEAAPPDTRVVDLAPDRPGPAMPDEPAPPDPAEPRPPDPPVPPEPQEPQEPQEPDAVRDVVEDVTGISPVTEPVGDLLLDLLGPRAS